MAEIEHDTGFLSIGEVLDLLVEEFPDVTISKIRFLESQGLISPQRTSSGYRKFYDEDVDLLRVILTEQQENFLPLKVIRKRLETGEIDPTGEHLKFERDDDTYTDGLERPVPDRSVTSHPASSRPANPTPPPARRIETPNNSALLPGVRVERDEFCSVASLSLDELGELESFGIIAPEPRNGVATYDAADVSIARAAGEFLRLGVDARHLRTFRTAVEREASLFEQLVAPRLRQRNPQAKREAIDHLRRLSQLGGELRHALMGDLLRHHIES